MLLHSMYRLMELASAVRPRSAQAAHGTTAVSAPRLKMLLSSYWERLQRAVSKGVANLRCRPTLSSTTKLGLARYTESTLSLRADVRIPAWRLTAGLWALFLLDGSTARAITSRFPEGERLVCLHSWWLLVGSSGGQLGNKRASSSEQRHDAALAPPTSALSPRAPSLQCS